MKREQGAPILAISPTGVQVSDEASVSRPLWGGHPFSRGCGIRPGCARVAILPGWGATPQRQQAGRQRHRAQRFDLTARLRYATT